MSKFSKAGKQLLAKTSYTMQSLSLYDSNISNINSYDCAFRRNMS